MNTLIVVIVHMICVCGISYLHKGCVFENGKQVCYCSDDKRYVNCAGHKLTYIPNITFPINSLSMHDNNLSRLTVKMLENITYRENITRLDISKNEIQDVEIYSLGMLTKLEVLDMSSNPLNDDALKTSLKNLSSTIRTLSLNDLRLSNTFRDDVFEPLSGSELMHLEMQNNRLQTILTGQLFKYLKNIRSLALWRNYIQDLNLTRSHSLQTLGLGRNDLTLVPDLCPNNRPLYPNLRKLYLDRNCIFRLDTRHINCLDKLQVLNISGTNMHSLENNVFYKLKSLEIVALEYSPSLQFINPLAFNSASLQRIYIRNNKLIFFPPFVYNTKIFSHCPNLTHLDISGNSLVHLKHEVWTQMLKHVPKLVYLDISRSGMLYLPAAIPNQLIHLQQLRFAFNQIHLLRENYFSPLKNLTALYLNNNMITRVNEGELPTHLTELNLAFNPYVCDCKILWFLSFLKRNRAILHFYPSEYICSDSKKLSDFNITIKSCLLSPSSSTIIKYTCLPILCFIVIFSVIIRYRWRISYVLHVLNYRRRKYTNCFNRTFTHDVYISCSQDDFNFVYHILVQKLELDGFNVYFPERDATPGRMIINEVLDHMDNSKAVMLCLSDAFTHDYWSEFEASMALERSVHESPDQHSLAVVLLEELFPTNVTKVLELILRRDDNIVWDENEDTNYLFWKKLYKHLRPGD